MSQKKAEPRKSKTYTKRTINLAMVYQVTRSGITITATGEEIADMLFQKFVDEVQNGRFALLATENEKP